MKNALLVLGLSTLSSLGFAQETSQNNREMDCCTCCNSCQKDVNCEAYTPPYYNLKCDCGMFLAVDFLYWYGRDSNLPYAIKNQTKLINNANPGNNLLSSPQDFKYLSTAWDPGVRVAFGFSSDCDGWDYLFAWTYYKNSKSGSSSVDPFPTGIAVLGELCLSAPWSSDLGVEDILYHYSKVSAKYKFRINQIDFEMGRRYWLSKCFTMRPFIGVRGAWTDTDFSTKALNPSLEISSTAILSFTYKDDFDNSFSGGGFYGGFQPNWYFTPCFSLYGSVDIGLLWGPHKLKKKEDYFVSQNDAGTISTPVDFENTAQMNASAMQALLDLGIGLRYENTYCDCQYRLSFDLGWEHHVWFRHNRRFQYASYTVTQISAEQETREPRLIETSHNTEFGGLVVRVRFDF